MIINERDRIRRSACAAIVIFAGLALAWPTIVAAGLFGPVVQIATRPIGVAAQFLFTVTPPNSNQFAHRIAIFCDPNRGL